MGWWAPLRSAKLNRNMLKPSSDPGSSYTCRVLQNNSPNPNQAVRAGPNFQTQRPQSESTNLWLQGTISIYTFQCRTTTPTFSKPKKNQRLQFPNPSTLSRLRLPYRCQLSKETCQAEGLSREFVTLFQSFPPGIIGIYLPKQNNDRGFFEPATKDYQSVGIAVPHFS